MTARGGCYCGDVRFEATRLLDARRITSAPEFAWVRVPLDGFRLLRGEPRRFDSSAHAWRCFCRRCGTHLYPRDDSEVLSLRVCALDEPAAVTPLVPLWCAGRVPWFDTADRLPRAAGGARPGD